MSSHGAALPHWPLARDHRREAKHRRVHGTTGLGDVRPPWWGLGDPPWLCQGAACAFILP